MERYICGDVRVEVYDNGIIRIERTSNGVFCDTNTFFVPDRAAMGALSSEHTVIGDINVGDYVITLPTDGFKGLSVKRGKKTVYKYKKTANSGELPAPGSTPELFAVADTPRLFIPEGGYSVERKGEYVIEENALDIYLLPCRGSAKRLRQLYVELTGRCELVRLSTLGSWNSKYYPYRQEEAQKLISDYEKYGVPLDNLVIDTDWRTSKRGQGYDINTKLFPDMRGFFEFAHSRGVEIMFNDHPEPVNGEGVFSAEEIAFRESNLKRLLGMGLDYWWYDRNWWTKLVSPTTIACETLGLYLYHDITADFFKKAASGRAYRRPVVMGNVTDVKNGEYIGISDSASHRYSIQWTGDISSLPDSLSREVENLIRCSDNCIAYVNSDCGGHFGNPDKALFVRWMQFGSFSPVLRPHCTCSVNRFREPWLYDEETLAIVREYVKMRYRLLPEIYRGAFENYAGGLPIFKNIGYEYESDKTACADRTEYMLGKNILISPIPGGEYVLVDKKYYASKVKASYYKGRELAGDPLCEAQLDMLDMDLADGVPPAEGVPCHDFSARFTTSVRFDRAVTLFIKCDDGATVYFDGKKVLEDKTTHAATLFPLCEIDDDIEHKLEIEYFQAEGEAYCALYTVDKQQKPHSAYLPEGEWVGLFDGRIHGGKNSIQACYELREMPLFVRLGGVIPLTHDAQNTKNIKLDRLILDWYPGKEYSDSGYVYEDDGETVAYKVGKYRTTGYDAAFNAQKNAFVMNISPTEGSFDGFRAVGKRTVTVRLHELGGIKIKRAAVNGKNILLERLQRSKSAYPFGSGSAPDSDIAYVEFEADTSSAYTVEFLL